MNIHLLLIPIALLLGLFFRKGSDKDRLWYIMLMSLILMVFVALRSSTTGLTETSDVVVYAYYFDNMSDYSWKDVLRSFVLHFGRSEDAGYLLLQKAIRMFTHDFHVFSFIADFIFFVPFGLILYKNSNSTKQLAFSWVFFIVMYYGHLLTGARQVYAVGFDWLAFMFFMENKYKKMVICLLLASTIHLSAIIIIVPMLLAKYTNGLVLKTGHLIALFLMPVSMYEANAIIRFMGNIVGSEKYMAYGEGMLQGGASTFILMIALLSVVVLFGIRKQEIDESFSLKCFYAMAPCFTFFAPLVNSNGSMIRISEYFHLFLVLLLPFAVESLLGKKSYIVYVVIIGVLGLWGIASSQGTYYFFWEK